MLFLYYHLWSMESGLGQPSPAGCGQPLTGTSSKLTLLLFERCFLQAFLSVQQEPRNCRLLTDRLILSTGFLLILKHSPYTCSGAPSLPGNSVSMGVGRWLILEEFPWFPKQPSAWEPREPVWPDLDPGSRAPAAALPFSWNRIWRGRL